MLDNETALPLFELIELFCFQGYAFKSEDIEFNGLTSLSTARSVSFCLRGAAEEDLTKFKSKLESNVLKLDSGNAVGQDICAMGCRVCNAILTEVAPSDPFVVNGVVIFEEILLKYTSLDSFDRSAFLAGME